MLQEQISQLGVKENVTMVILPEDYKDINVQRLAAELVVRLSAGPKNKRLWNGKQIDRILKEHEISLSGMANPTERIKVGKLLKADILVSLRQISFKTDEKTNDAFLSVRMIGKCNRNCPHRLCMSRPPANRRDRGIEKAVRLAISKNQSAGQVAATFSPPLGFHPSEADTKRRAPPFCNALAHSS